MNNYLIYTDSACDMEASTLESWNVKYQSLTLSFTDDGKMIKNSDIDPIKFYQRMRDGGVAKTSAVNIETFKRGFEEELKDGKDILYLGFSSGLSTTYNSAAMAAQQLQESYPDRKIITIDTLCASAGFGLLLYTAVKKKEEGASIEENAKYIEDNKLNLCHWFTVDDLEYLKRGGRVSTTAAFVGGLLGIKPVMHVDNEGHLIPVSKVRGRKASLQAIATKYDELALDKENGTVFICHADCQKDVDYLVGLIKEKHGNNVDMVVYTGPVIGAHSGPGTIALFFLGRER